MRFFRRLHAALDRIDDTIDRNTAAFEDLQVVIRESRIREERTLQAFEERLAANTEQIRAQTEAIWRLLDRWGEGPAPAS